MPASLFRNCSLLFLTAVSLSATTLTGTLAGPSGVGLTGTLTLSLSQQAALSSAGSCGGPAEIVPNVPVKITVTNGSLIGSPTVYGNDCMLPGNLYYLVTVLDSNGNQLLSDRWVIGGSTINIGTIVSAIISGTTTTLGASNLIIGTPAGNQTVNQPVGSTLSVNLFTVSNTFTLPNGGVCNAGGCTGLNGDIMTTDTNQNASGQKTFLQPLIAPGYNGNVASAGNTFFNSDLSMHIDYQGNAFFQTYQATTTFNSLADIAGSPATTAAFQTSHGDFVVYGNGWITGQTLATHIVNGVNSGAFFPTGCSMTPFLSNTCATFINADRSYAVDIYGNVAAQTYAATSTYNSLADVNCIAFSGGCSVYGTAMTAFQNSGGTFKVLGDGSVWSPAGTFNTITTNTVYNVGVTAGVTGSTCTAWIGGICTHL